MHTKQIREIIPLFFFSQVLLKSLFQRLSFWNIAKLDSDTITGIILSFVVSYQPGFIVDNRHTQAEVSQLRRHCGRKTSYKVFPALWNRDGLLSTVIKLDDFPWECNATMDFDESLWVSVVFWCLKVFEQLSFPKWAVLIVA